MATAYDTDLERNAAADRAAPLEHEPAVFEYPRSRPSSQLNGADDFPACADGGSPARSTPLRFAS